MPVGVVAHRLSPHRHAPEKFGGDFHPATGHRQFGPGLLSGDLAGDNAWSEQLKLPRRQRYADQYAWGFICFDKPI
jgi:hypothetical protein